MTSKHLFSSPPKLGTWLAILVALLIAAGGSVGAVAAAPAQQTASIDLCATTGTVTMPNNASITIWGYAPGDCSDSPTATLPGPTLEVNEGDVVTVNLYNNLPENSALLLQGQAMIPDLEGAPGGGSQTYTFTASAPGTYLYEAGPTPNGQHQAAMGMYGALVVRSATAGQAYNDPDTAYDVEAVLVLSEIDPNLNNSSTPAAFDMRNYKPRYFLINGAAYPDTAAVLALAGDRVLLRYVNAGVDFHSMALLGLHQTVIANDGSLLDFSHAMVAETFGPGQTVDTIATIPVTAVAGSQFALYDGDLMQHNSNAAGVGGMLTFLTVGTTPPPGADETGPTVSSVLLVPNPTDGTTAVSLSATVSDASTGNSNVSAAEYFIDAIGADGSGTAMSGAFGSPTTAVNATLSTALLATLSSDSHTIFVHGQDSAGNWGATNFAILNLDAGGPTTSGVTLTPDHTNGTVGVAVHATGDDSGSGGADIAAAEYRIDGGTAVSMNVGTAAPITSLDQTIPAAVVNSLTEGVHSVSVRSQDAFGNWGAAASADLVIDKTGPATSGVSAAPNPNNGQQPINSGTPAVRVTATLNDTASNIVAAEGFIDTEGTNGTGFVFAAADGQLDSLSEVTLSDIPLATINLLPAGNHTIYVHGKDAAGNWGPTSSTILLVDKTAPTVSGTAAVPNPTAGSASVTLTATANDASTAVTAAEWFTGADPGVGNGTAMTVSGTGPWSLAATLNVSSWPIGSYTLNVRARDAAGNWSALSSTVLVVSVPPVSFSTLGNTNPPGVGGAADDADLYQWNGTYSRLFDATAAGLPGSANVDAYHRVDATHFYLSFSSTTTFVPGLGNVQDEDVVYYNNGVWSVYFDGTAHGLTSSNEDIDAISIVGSVLYFSTVGNTNPPGVGGFPDDADIYSWNGSSYARVWDASTHGLSGFTDVDGVKVIDATHLYLSFNGTVTNVPGLGFEQDEDLVYYNNGVWSVYFNGTAYGLGTSGNLDIDAFDIP